MAVISDDVDGASTHSEDSFLAGEADGVCVGGMPLVGTSAAISVGGE